MRTPGDARGAKFRPMLAPAVLILVAFAAVAMASEPARKTLVTIFQPAIPKGKSRSGHCWTDSIAVVRPDAWRCMVGNEIYDPCFSRELKNAVICDANPADNKPGFVLKLTKPLPEPSQSHAPPRPWLVKLEDGTVCEIQTGTIASVDGIGVPYGCSDSHPCNDSGCPYMTGLTEDFTRGESWTADKVAFSSSKNGLKLISRKRVPVAAVWK